MSTTAKISWVEGALFVAESGSGHTFTMDGAPDVGGRDLGARPMEVMLMGMGGCTAIDVVSMLKKQRQDIEGVEVSMVAERADDHPKVFTDVTTEGAGRCQYCGTVYQLKAGEKPQAEVLAGGALVIGALVANEWLGSRAGA